MKTLVTAIKKGGQGKTMVTCHLAYDFGERGLRVAVIDLDSQANASWTLAGYDTGVPASTLFSDKPPAVAKMLAGLPSERTISLFHADPALANLDRLDYTAAGAALRANLAVLAKSFDVTLIDTAPSLGVGMSAALLAADYMLSPIELEAYSLQGMRSMVAIVGNLRKQNPGLRFLGLVPNLVDARKPRHSSNLAALRKAYPQLVLPFTVGSRDSIAQALGEQKPVWGIRKTAARQASKEVRALAAHVHDKMELGR